MYKSKTEAYDSLIMEQGDINRKREAFANIMGNKSFNLNDTKKKKDKTSCLLSAKLFIDIKSSLLNHKSECVISDKNSAFSFFTNLTLPQSCL